MSAEQTREIGVHANRADLNQRRNIGSALVSHDEPIDHDMDSRIKRYMKAGKFDGAFEALPEVVLCTHSGNAMKSGCDGVQRKDEPHEQKGEN